MIAITFVKLVIVVFAYQQLLHNGFIIIQNLYNKHFGLTVCSRPYQLKSGHGLDVEENSLGRTYQTQIKQKSQLLKLQIQWPEAKCLRMLKQLHNFIESLITHGKYSAKLISAENRYNLFQTENQLFFTLNVLNANNQLHMQQNFKDNEHYQQFDYNHHHHRIKYHRKHYNFEFYYHNNNRYFYSRDHQLHPCYQGYCYQLDTTRKKPRATTTTTTTTVEKSNLKNTTTMTASLFLRKLYSKSKKPKLTGCLFRSRIIKSINYPIADVQFYHSTQLLIPTLPSFSSTICYWKSTGSRKRRKRKYSFVHDKYEHKRNCRYLVRKRSSTYSCCCIYNSFNKFFSEYFHIYCCSACKCGIISYSWSHRCICEINPNVCVSRSKGLNNECKLNPSNKNIYRYKSSSLNIINITKDIDESSGEVSRSWCINELHNGDSEVENGNGLLRSLNAVKAITSLVQNRNYKRKLKKNLVWLIIGLVWLEGPKLINCSISHSTNDITSMNGNETTNKIAGDQNSNSDNSSNNSERNGDTNNSSHSSGSSSNTNGPGPTTRPNAIESKSKKSFSYNEYNNNILFNGKNHFFQKTFEKEHSQISKKQFHYQNAYQANRMQHQESFIVSRVGYITNRPTKRRPENSLIESEEENHARSDLARLESIKQQILRKLGLTEKPNVTQPLPKQFIWDTIYRADGIRSVSDFDFNDNHRTQENLRLTPAVLEPPPLFPNRYPPSVSIKKNVRKNQSNKVILSHEVKENYNERENEVSTVKEMFNSSWRILNLTKEQEDQILLRYHKKHKQQQQQRLRINKNSSNRNENKYAEGEETEGDDFFGSTQEIITFAEKGKVYKRHRLVEFSPPSNKIPRQKLQIRNAEIHIRIEKNVAGQFKHLHNHKFSPPNLKIWIFQLIGTDFNSKGFDQVATLSTSLSVDHNVLGWQKLDITKTVQFWYNKHPKDKLRLLIDCSGCGNHYILHLFDKKLHNSPLMSSKTKIRQTNNVIQENENISNSSYTTLKNGSSVDNQSHTYNHHYRQKNRHRNRRKNRVAQQEQRLKTPNQHYFTQGVSEGHLLSSRKRRKGREVMTSQERMEGMSYEVGAEFHLEDRVNPNIPFLVLHTEPSRSRRVRRRAVDCSGAMFGQCCKESFYVSFKALGWDDWIIAPRGYFANYCRGDCTGPFRTPDTFQTFHAHFIEEYRKMGLLNGMKPCCAPVKFSSMSLIYYGDDGIIKRDLPKMVVDECGCP